MGVTIYPAILVEDEAAGTKTWENVVPIQGNPDRLKKDADTADYENPFEPNPEYFPFSSMDMSEGNLLSILRLIGIKRNPDSMNAIPIKLAFEQAHKFLYVGNRSRDMEDYTMERVLSIREMACLGITRGATHLVWA